MVEQENVWNIYALICLIHMFNPDAGESVDMDCWSLMTVKQSSLICALSEYDLDICEKFATLWYNAVSSLSVSFIICIVSLAYYRFDSILLFCL